MEIDGDRLKSISFFFPVFLLLFHTLLSFSPDGDRWHGAPGLGPCRLIIDQEDRDGSRDGEDTEERRGEGCGVEAEVEEWEDFKEFMF